jgi:hypothetical protein
MTPWLVLVSGWIEVLFGVSAMLAPSIVVAGIGGSDLDGPAMVMVRVLGVATFATGVGALLGRNWSSTTDGQKTAYGLDSCAAISLALYNILAARALGRGPSTLGCCKLLHLRLRKARLKRYAPAKAKWRPSKLRPIYGSLLWLKGKTAFLRCFRGGNFGQASYRVCRSDYRRASRVPDSRVVTCELWNGRRPQSCSAGA